MTNDPESKIKELIRSRLPALVLFARQWSHFAAEDIAQEAFVKLYRQDPWPDDPVAWLFTVVRNASNNHVRAGKRRKRHEQEARRSHLWFLPAKDEEEQNGDLIRALESLDRKDREIIVAKIWGDLTFEQIAELPGCSTAAAHRRYKAGLARLLERLERPCPSTNPTT